MEMHAHVPKLGHTLSHWVLEGVFITVSVLLGFWVNQVREEHQNRELAVRVLKGLDAEIKDNLATLEPFIALHQKWIKSNLPRHFDVIGEGCRSNAPHL